jgi:hypothetical protein
MSLVANRGSSFKPSHTFLIIGKLGDKHLILETTDFEVCITTLEGKYDNGDKYETRFFKPLLPVNKECLNYALSFQGTVYGYFQLLTFALKILFKRILKKDIRNLNQWGMVCTAVPIYYYSKMNSLVNPLGRFEPEQTMTGELYDFLLDSKDFQPI